MSKEPLYPHTSKKKEPLFPHVPKGQQSLRKAYTPSELADIARIFYETMGIKTATVFTSTGPLYGKWENLTQPQRDQAIEGLRVRIEREGLLGYLERKRPAAGDELTNSIIAQLRAKGYLSSPVSGSVPQAFHISEPLASELRRELRKLPAWKLEEAYNMLKTDEPTTGIDILDRHRAEALNAVKEALWERGKLAYPNEYVEAHFSGVGAGDIQWETVFGKKLTIITVTNITGVPQYQLEIDFRDSVARIFNLMASRDLPFAGADRGTLRWMATINDKPVTVEVSGIRLLTQIQLKDAFCDSMARIEEIDLNSMAKTDGNPISKYCCRLCDDCAPVELLGEGKFLERISWLRHHYQEKHPGMWGRVGKSV